MVSYFASQFNPLQTFRTSIQTIPHFSYFKFRLKLFKILTTIQMAPNTKNVSMCVCVRERERAARDLKRKRKIIKEKRKNFDETLLEEGFRSAELQDQHQELLS